MDSALASCSGAVMAIKTDLRRDGGVVKLRIHPAHCVMTNITRLVGKNMVGTFTPRNGPIVTTFASPNRL